VRGAEENRKTGAHTEAQRHREDLHLRASPAWRLHPALTPVPLSQTAGRGGASSVSARACGGAIRRARPLGALGGSSPHTPWSPLPGQLLGEGGSCKLPGEGHV
ncbi:MAG: hypothetical protein AVDCRST_MAG68-3265, partial [uncultured Gemmatimonadetes bacterium]